MKISIITAAYNSAATIGDTLKSIAAQTYPQVEHIIIDGVSKDETLEIVKKFPHVARVVSEKDKGIYDAMNKGINLAGGDVIGILNSDDMYTDGTVIAKVMEKFSDETVDAVYGDLQYVDQHNTGKVVRTWKAGNFTRKSFYYGWMPPHPSFFVRKRVYDRLGLFNLELKTAADYEIIIRFLLKNQVKAVYLPEVLVKMRAGGASNASFRNRIRANREDRIAWQMNGLHPNPFTLILKPLRKVNQFLIK
jgi:glycosyltransferase involved in cell wall biosynthesis